MKKTSSLNKKKGILGFITFFFPVYSFIPVVIWFILNFSAYYGTRVLNSGAYHYDLSTAVDDIIPFVPCAITVYVLWYLQIIIGFCLVARESREVCYEIFSSEAVAKIITAIIFIFLPTAMVRAEISGGGFFNFLTSLIYAADTPDNLFPSIHCLESWLLLRGILKCSKVSKTFKICFGIFSILVFASVVLVKQHLFVDIPSAIIVAEAGLFIARKTKAWKIYEKLSGLISRRNKEK